MAETIREAIVKLTLQPDDKPVKAPNTKEFKKDVKDVQDKVDKATEAVDKHTKKVEEGSIRQETGWHRTNRAIGLLVSNIAQLSGNDDLIKFTQSFSLVMSTIQNAGRAIEQLERLSNSMNIVSTASTAASVSNNALGTSNMFVATTSTAAGRGMTILLAAVVPITIALGVVTAAYLLMGESSKDVTNAILRDMEKQRKGVTDFTDVLLKINKIRQTELGLVSRLAVIKKRNVELDKEAARLTANDEKTINQLKYSRRDIVREGTQAEKNLRQRSGFDRDLTDEVRVSVGTDLAASKIDQKTQQLLLGIQERKLVIVEKIIIANDRKITQAKEELKHLRGQRRESELKLKAVEDAAKSTKQRFGQLSPKEALEIRRIANKDEGARSFEEKQRFASFGPKAKQSFENASERRAESLGFAQVSKESGLDDSVTKARKDAKFIQGAIAEGQAEIADEIATLRQANQIASKTGQMIVSAMTDTLKLLQDLEHDIERLTQTLERLKTHDD